MASIGNINYSFNKNDFYNILYGNIVGFIPYYYILTFLTLMYLFIIRFQQYYFSERKEGYRKNESLMLFFKSITFNMPFDILKLSEEKKGNDSFIGLTSKSYIFIILIYVITYIVILQNLIKNFVYSVYVNIVQANPNNNPYNNTNCVSKINKSSYISAIANYSKIIGSSFLFLIPFSIPFIIKLFHFDAYDIKKNTWFSYIILFLIVSPAIGLMSYSSVLPDLLPYIEQKDSKFVDFVQGNFLTNFFAIFGFVMIIFIYCYYNFVYLQYKLDFKEAILGYFIIFICVFVFIPVIMIYFGLAILFSNNRTDGNDNNGDSVTNNIITDGVKNIYELLVKYNYPCFPK